MLGVEVRLAKSGSSRDFFFVRRDGWGFPGPGEIESSLLYVEGDGDDEWSVRCVRFGLLALDAEFPIGGNDEKRQRSLLFVSVSFHRHLLPQSDFAAEKFHFCSLSEY